MNEQLEYLELLCKYWGDKVGIIYEHNMVHLMRGDDKSPVCSGKSIEDIIQKQSLHFSKELFKKHKS